ncbi:hypothetical protein [Brassicibacter mesophilus]|uniref:hypothetical protein n=1 Tax=Brassicibacter mesophilus TaxID=745119 RepID=UPI003D1B3AD9
MKSNTEQVFLLKYAFVVERLYNVLSISFRCLIAKREMNVQIEEVVIYLKTKLADGEKLLGYDDKLLEVTDFQG